MGYIFAGGLGLIFLIWLIYFEFHDNKKHLEAKEHINNQFKNKSTIQSDENGNVQCPKCGSVQIELMKRGWKITTGFIGSGKNIRVCKNCLHKF